MASKLGFALLLLSLVSTSCAIGRQNTNEPIDAVAVNQLVAGQSTAQQVVALLGGPNEVVQLGRRSAHYYVSDKTKTAGLILVVFNMFHQDNRSDRLWVFFDENDVLTHYGVTYGTHRTQYALPWEDVHEASDNEVRDRERAGVLTPREGND